MWRTLAVVALVTLAGCGALLPGAGGGGSDDAVTPAPVPATETPVSVPMADGAVDIERLVERHHAALADRSYHRRVVREGPENTREVWVDRDAGVVRVRQTFGPLVNDAVLVDGRAYSNVQDDPDTDYTTFRTNGSVPYVTSLSGRALLGQALTADRYVLAGEVSRDGRQLAVVTAVSEPQQGTAEPPEDIVTVSRLLVDRSGVIRAVEHRSRWQDGTALRVTMTVETGLDRVPIPWWLSEADPYTSGSM